VPVASSVEYKREGRGGFWQSFSANTEFSTLDRETGMQMPNPNVPGNRRWSKSGAAVLSG
jgi:hypothetical protein